MTKFSRRTFIERLSLLGLLPAVAWVGCQESGTASSAADQPPPPPPSAPTAPPAPSSTVSGEAVCDVSKLDPAALGPRNALGYKEASPDPARVCEGCALFIADIGGCAGCKLFKGPVAPKGTCNSFAPRA